MVAACRARGWVTGENQPYSGHLDGDSIDRHALAAGRPNMLIEVRNDLIADEAGQREWAERRFVEEIEPLLTPIACFVPQ